MNLHVVRYFLNRQGAAKSFIKQPACHHIHVMTCPGQIKSQVRKELACRGVIGKEESIDEEDLQIDVPSLIHYRGTRRNLRVLTHPSSCVRNSQAPLLDDTPPARSR